MGSSAPLEAQVGLQIAGSTALDRKEWSEEHPNRHHRPSRQRRCRKKMVWTSECVERGSRPPVADEVEGRASSDSIWFHPGQDKIERLDHKHLEQKHDYNMATVPFLIFGIAVAWKTNQDNV